MFDSAVAAIAAGSVVGTPTDTVYGLAIDPLNEAAVHRLFEIKGRPVAKPIGLLVPSWEAAAEIGTFGDAALRLAQRFWPGGLTLLVRPRVVLSDWVGNRQTETVGLRMPDHPTVLGLLELTGPLAVTSANRSGEPDSVDDEQARSIFADEVAVYLPGSSPGGVASTVVDATGSRMAVLRQGSVVIDG